MLVKSALLNLEVQQFFAFCLPLVLFPVCLCRSLLPSLARSVIHSINVFFFFLSVLICLSTSKFRMFSSHLSRFLGFLPGDALNVELKLCLAHLSFLYPHVLLVFY